MKYVIKTDAVMDEINARSFNEAAQKFAVSEGLAGKTMDEVFESIRAIDGAWIWIENRRGIRHSAGNLP